MIAYFPDAYENELLYSWLARYYQKSGYVAYRDVAEDLFVKPTVRPDVEFINPLTNDAIKMLCRNSSMEEVVLNHTMYSYYGRFLPLERRKEAFKTMVAMEGKMVDKFPMKLLNGKERYLRYCPLCVQEQRDKYGETYWSREHQCPDIRICTKHNVFLQDSTMNINYTSPNLVAAEMIIPEESPIIYNENKLEYEISKYICEVFLAPVDFENDTLYGKFLHNKLAGTKYLSRRGGAKRISDLFQDITDYYVGLEIFKIEKLWHLEQIFTSHRFYLSDIVAIAYFLGISKEELLSPVIEIEDLPKQFDEQVRKLHDEGLNYMQIAKKLGSAYDMTTSIVQFLIIEILNVIKHADGIPCGENAYDKKQKHNKTIKLRRCAECGKLFVIKNSKGHMADYCNYEGPEGFCKEIVAIRNKESGTKIEKHCKKVLERIRKRAERWGAIYNRDEAEKAFETKKLELLEKGVDENTFIKEMDAWWETHCYDN